MGFESPRFAGNPVLEEILDDPDTGTKKLGPGSDPDAVTRLQQALFDLGWSLVTDPPVATADEFVDGDYGPATKRTVLAYKTHYDLRFPPDDPNGFIDDFAGPRTMRKLDPQVVLLDEADAAIVPKIAELQGAGLDVIPADQTSIFDNTPGAVRPATIDTTEGGIYYKRGVGPFEVHGAIFASYTAEHGSAEGDLGYPVSDEMDNPDVVGGRMNEFENGTLFWDPDSGVTTEAVEPTPIQIVVVKLVDEIALGLAPQESVTAEDLVARVPSPEGPGVAQALAALIPGSVLRPVFDLAGTPELDEMIAEAKSQDPEYVPPNFSNYLELECPDEIDPQLVVDALTQWVGVVELAYVQPVATDPAVTGTTNPLFTQQGYLAAAPGGIGVQTAWGTKADGTGTRFIDLEQGWFLGHEDLPPGIPLLDGVLINASRPHGCAVLGIVVGVDNTVGVAGIAPATNARVISYARRPDPPFDSQRSRQLVANMILNAGRSLSFGDVLQLEAQFAAVFKGVRHAAPVEVAPAVFDAIRLTTKFGVIVVEAAGNGNSNLDDFRDAQNRAVLTRGNPDFKDSGAIMVGSCTSATPHTKFTSSNFGSRIDCCAWGEKIVTTGNDRTPTKKDAYRTDFGGTSGASPIIVGICLLIQHMRVLKTPKVGVGKLGPSRMRQILSNPSNGTAVGGTQRVGPMPDFAKIIPSEFN